jgi:hypothetical protein
MKKLIIGLAMASLSLTSSAEINYSLGEWGSGGGNAIVCFANVTEVIDGRVVDRNLPEEIRENNNQIPDELLKWVDTIEMYDLYDAKKKRGISSKSPKIINIREDEQIYIYLDRVGNRFSKSVNLLKGIIKYGKELLPEDNIVWEETAVQHQNDLGTVSLPGKRCVIATMAAQVNHNDYYMAYIDSRLFNHPKHSKQSKATLILHELVYAVMREQLKETDSGSTRNIVRYLISSHSSYTEGKISEVLGRLGLSEITGIDNLSDISKKFFWSVIMQQLRMELDSFQYSLNNAALYEYNSTSNLELRREIISLVNRENILDPSHFENNFLGQLNMIIKSSEVSTYQKEWLKIANKYSKTRDNLLAQIKREISDYRAEIIDTIKQRTKITKSDFALLEAKLDIYFEDYTYPGADKEFFEYIYKRNNESFLVNSIFDHFLVYEQCSANFPGSGQDVSTDTKIESCYGPLKLDYIIPNKAI